jgi:hypothetical protein
MNTGVDDLMGICVLASGLCELWLIKEEVVPSISSIYDS